MNWHDVGNILTEIVKWLSAVGVITAALNKWAAQPFMARFERAVKRNIVPIEELIEQLRRQNELSERERQQIKELTARNQEILAQHEKRLDIHHEQIVRLETRSEFGRQTMKYREEYLGGGERERTL